MVYFPDHPTLALFYSRSNSTCEPTKVIDFTTKHAAAQVNANDVHASGTIATHVVRYM